MVLVHFMNNSQMKTLQNFIMPNAISTANNTETSPKSTENPKQSSKYGNILIVSLGKGEDEVVTIRIANLLSSYGHRVTIILYGDQREIPLTTHVNVIVIPIQNDLMHQSSEIHGFTPQDSSKLEWMSSKIIQSRLAACHEFSQYENQIRHFNASLIITPLFLQDICVLPLSFLLNVPIIGVMTSRVGSWWTWAQLGVVPQLSLVPVPLWRIGSSSLWSRMSNVAQHYSYMSSFRQQYHSQALKILPEHWKMTSSEGMYEKVVRLLVSWDPIVSSLPLPIPMAIPVGGFTSNQAVEIPKDLVVPALLNRAGLIVVAVETTESWIGETASNVLYQELSKMPFTVLWHLPNPKWRPQLLTNIDAKFIFKNHLPIDSVLSNSRHRFFVSTCSESAIMSAVHFASPILCLPVTTDQILASRDIEKLGTTEVVMASGITAEKISRALGRLSTTRTYRIKARSLAEELHDQSTSPEERLVFHVENVLRRPNSTRYKFSKTNLPLWQQSNADVYLVIIFLLVLCGGMLITACVFIYPVLRKSKRKSE